MKRITLISFIMLFFVTTQHAQMQHPRCSKPNNQQLRIKKGAKSDALTRLEAKQLIRQQKHIQRTKRQYKRDGRYTIQERRHIKALKQKAAMNINLKKNNIKTKRR